MADSPTVLVLGMRNGLARALRRRGIQPWVWNDRPLTHLPPDRLLVRPFLRSRRAISNALTPWLRGRQFTHVIAAKEAAVYAASIARRIVGARQSQHTTVLRCRDKFRMKRYLAAADIPMTPFAAGYQRASIEALMRDHGFPLVVKDRLGLGGKNMQTVRSPDEWQTARLRDRLVEAYVDAPELSVESFIDDGRVLFVNVTEYHVKRFVNLVPAHTEDALVRRILDLNRRVIERLDIKWGMTHLEVYAKRDEILFGEIALRPPGGYIMELLEAAYDFDPWEAFVSVELGEPFEFPSAPTHFSAVEILHPGAGAIRAISGIDETRALPHVLRLEVKVTTGTTLGTREGVGQDIGHVVHRAPTPEALMNSIRRSHDILRIDLEPESG